MIRLSIRFLLSLLAPALLGGVLMAGTALAGGQQAGGKVYRWVDKNGQVHYGQSVPPEYAEQDREIINKHGVAVDREEGTITAAEAASAAATEKARREVAQRQQRDRVLLQTYQSADEIAALRDRRLDLLDAQLTIQETSLRTLYRKHDALKAQEAKFKPINTQPNAQPIPEGLRPDIERSKLDIATHEANLAKKRDERADTIKKFDSDIERFRELKAQ